MGRHGDLFSQQETSLPSVLEQLYDNGDKQFIFLVDKWDCVMRERQESEELQRQYLDFVRDIHVSDCILPNIQFHAVGYNDGGGRITMRHCKDVEFKIR